MFSSVTPKKCAFTQRQLKLRVSREVSVCL